MPYKRVTQVISPKSQVSEKSSQRKSFLNSKIRSPHGTRGNKVRVLKAKRLMRSKHSDISPEIQERSYDYSRKSTKNPKTSFVVHYRSSGDAWSSGMAYRFF